MWHWGWYVWSAIALKRGRASPPPPPPFFFSSWRAIGMVGGVRMSGVNNRKSVIDFRSSQVRQAHSCIRNQWKTFNMSSDPFRCLVHVLGKTAMHMWLIAFRLRVYRTYSHVLFEEFFRPSVRVIYGVEVIAINLESWTQTWNGHNTVYVSSHRPTRHELNRNQPNREFVLGK